ncbi:MAG TPA: M23 family metallopeptidase [Pyrinomonadaceae bacterium]|nr:M23 family metallopeptidase [Pyrinomonadaceae bacterium]
MTTPATRARLRVLVIFALAVTAVSLFVWTTAKRSGTNLENNSQHTSESLQPTASPATSATSPQPSGVNPTPSPPDMKADPAVTENQQQSQDATLANNFVGTLKLIIPVAGVRPDQLLDTFTDSRSEGRAHDAIDIMAPAGTPVVAAADGEIIKLFPSERGGTTIYQLTPDKKLMFYYAHLQRYADGIEVGKFVRQGETIAFVGDTGNAGAGNYHLHFSISIVADPKRYWEGTNINPYPLLK